MEIPALIAISEAPETLQRQIAEVVYKWSGHYLFYIRYDEESDTQMIFLPNRNGASMARVYWYLDEPIPSYVVLDSIHVQPSQRRLGEGTRLQEVREEIGRAIGAKKSALWVKRGTWQVGWYAKRGYVSGKRMKTQPGCVWMWKDL